MNQSRPAMFEFSGLTDNTALAVFLFVFFLLVYTITVVANIGLFVVVYKTSSLHTPMYYFLRYLSVVDLFYSSDIVPKMISDIFFRRKFISFHGCALQFYFFAALASIDVHLLSNMSYDRYAAICQPLQYVSIMTTNKCFYMVLIAFVLGFLQSSVQTSCIFSLQYCGSNHIDHFYCDISPLLKLSCSDTFTCEMAITSLIGFYSIVSLATILISYSFIIFSILKIKSAKGRQKAFSTCSSHVICASIFYVSVFLTYLHPPSNVNDKQSKVASIFYCVMTPMLNPLIYSLRNQEVKTIIVQAMHSLNSLKEKVLHHSGLTEKVLHSGLKKKVLHHSGLKEKVLHHSGLKEKVLHSGLKEKVLHHSGLMEKVLHHYGLKEKVLHSGLKKVLH
ncbi:olfactory receptor 1019-like [Hyla sarda]|uniref:olfactory receptor 1019-like n=1 Tax=Hyla sarda TaxID=327740 RepID=UPI0024C3FB70|nr:olfactory receptor 1019-like [Hyla sarda]